MKKISPILWWLSLETRGVTSFHSVIPFSFCARNCNSFSISQTSLFSSSNENSDDVWLKEKERVQDVIRKLETLEETIKESQDGDDMNQISKSIDDLEEEYIKSSKSLFLPPKGLSAQDYEMAILTFIKLPFVLKVGFVKALEMEESILQDWRSSTPDIVSRMYERRAQLTVLRLEDSLKEAKSMMLQSQPQPQLQPQPLLQSQTLAKETVRKNTDAFVEETTKDNTIKQQLGRVCRKTNKVVTPQDLETIMKTFGDDKTLWEVQGQPEPIPGGYVIRGQNKRATPKDFIAAVDEALPKSFPCQISLMEDITNDGLEKQIKTGSPDGPILIVLNKDFTPESNGLIRGLFSAAALFTTFLYCINAFSGNDSIVSMISNWSSVGDISGFNWFNDRLLDVFFPIVAIQVVHQIGHFIIAQRDNVQTAFPTLIPFSKLPFFGAQTSITTSPPDKSSLFDFSFLGPFFGIMASLIFLVVGTQATLAADPTTLQYFPTLSVQTIRLSTLGSAVIDALMGGEGVITAQNPNTPVLLHPYVIAGFTGLLINSLDLLPLGSNDGGRMSQAVFGRGGHIIIGGMVWFLLLVTNFFIGDYNDLLIGAWLVNNIAQNDMEIPCREEVTSVDLVRSFAGFGLWFVAILAVVPLDVIQ